MALQTHWKNQLRYTVLPTVKTCTGILNKNKHYRQLFCGNIIYPIWEKEVEVYTLSTEKPGPVIISEKKIPE